MFYKNVSPSNGLQNVVNDANNVVRDFSTEALMCLNVFCAKTAAQAHMKTSGQWDDLNPEERQLVEKTQW
jgi:metallopeptidase MepB